MSRVSSPELLVGIAKVRLYRIERHERLSPRDGLVFAKSDRAGPHKERLIHKSLVSLKSIEFRRNEGTFCGLAEFIFCLPIVLSESHALFGVLCSS